MDERPVLDRIERLVEEEHRLWRASDGQISVVPADSPRTRRVSTYSA